KPPKSGLSLGRKVNKRRALISLLVALLLVGALLAVWHFMQPPRSGEEPTASPTAANQQKPVQASEPAEGVTTQTDAPIDRPRQLNIPSLGIRGANVVPVGVESSGEMAAPSTNHQVG